MLIAGSSGCDSDVVRASGKLLRVVNRCKDWRGRALAYWGMNPSTPKSTSYTESLVASTVVPSGENATPTS